MSKENVAEFPNGLKLDAKDTQAIADFVEKVVDARVHRHLEALPETLAQMGIKLPRPETTKDKVIRAGMVVGIVAATVTTTLVLQRIIERKREVKVVEEEKEMGNGNRVRPVGSRTVSAQLSN